MSRIEELKDKLSKEDYENFKESACCSAGVYDGLRHICLIRQRGGQKELSASRRLDCLRSGHSEFAGCLLRQNRCRHKRIQLLELCG